MQNKVDTAKRYLSEEGLEICQNGKKDDIKAIINKALNIDLRDIGVAGIPEDVGKGKVEQIQGPLVVQIQKIRNASAPKANEESQGAPRLLKLTVTDGKSTLNAIEEHSISGLSLNTPPGTKLCLKGTIDLVNGFLHLNKSSQDVLGGKVEALIEKWEFNRSVAKYRQFGDSSEAGPPPWIPFGQKKNVPNRKQDPAFKSLSQSSSETKEETEFDAQRKGAIAEAAKGGARKVFRGGNRTLLDHNVEQLSNAGFTVEQSQSALQRCNNEVDRALKYLQRTYGYQQPPPDFDRNVSNKPRPTKDSLNTKPSTTTASSSSNNSNTLGGGGGKGGNERSMDGGEGRGGGRRGGRRKEGEEEEGKSRPSGAVSLFEFLQDKLPASMVQESKKNTENSRYNNSTNNHNNRSYGDHSRSYGDSSNNRSYGGDNSNRTYGGDNNRWDGSDARSRGGGPPRKGNDRRDERNSSVQMEHQKPPRFQNQNRNRDHYTSNHNNATGKRNPSHTTPTQYTFSESNNVSVTLSDSFVQGTWSNANYEETIRDTRPPTQQHHEERNGTGVQNSVKESPWTPQSAPSLWDSSLDIPTFTPSLAQPPPSQPPLKPQTQQPPPFYQQQQQQQPLNATRPPPFTNAQPTTYQNGGGGTNGYTWSDPNLNAFSHPPPHGGVTSSGSMVGVTSSGGVVGVTSQQSQLMNGLNHTWKIGDKCLAKYWEDGKYYRAEVTAVTDNTCVVHFIEYGNYEEVFRRDCAPLPDTLNYPTCMPTTISTGGTFMPFGNGHFSGTVEFRRGGNQPFFKPTEDSTNCLISASNPQVPIDAPTIWEQQGRDPSGWQYYAPPTRKQ